jgi:hypothetical protein
VEIELTWDSVPGADHYWVYRTLTVDGGARDLRLLAQVDDTGGPSHTFVDSSDPSGFLDDAKTPREVGALGEWHTAGALATPRAAYGFTDVVQSGCSRFWYLYGGVTDVAAETATYDVAVVDPTGVIGSFATFTAAGTSARRELAVWHANQENSTASLTGCDFYFYAGPGNASGGVQAGPQVALVSSTTTGELGAFANAGTGGTQKTVTGYAAFMSGSLAYMLGGSGPAVTRDILDGDLTGGGPNFSNFNDASTDLITARRLYGFTREGAFNYLVGGQGATGVLQAAEFNVR